MVLSKDFYSRNTVDVAKELLGCKLSRRLGNEVISGVIVETEAYTQDDPACHAFRGRTKRASTLFKQPGLSYVYLIYGMYHCMNIVTEPEDTAGAVLIRALETLGQIKNSNGPGKLCRELLITKDLNEVDMTNSKNDMWVEKYMDIAPENIVVTTRIGIKEAADYPWRFYVKDNQFVSRR